MIGRYLDRLADAGHTNALDRVIEAQAWCDGSFVDASGARCLLGHAENWDHDDMWGKEVASVPGGSKDCRPGWRDRATAPHFDALVARFGMDRIVRAVKLRAAKRNRIELPAPETVEHAEA